MDKIIVKGKLVETRYNDRVKKDGDMTATIELNQFS